MKREDRSLTQLLSCVAEVEGRIRSLVAERRAGDPTPDDPFRGLYITDDTVDRLLSGASANHLHDENGDAAYDVAPSISSEARVGRLGTVARTFSLTALDVDVLLVALAPDLDPRFEQLFGYLNDDVTRRRPSVAVALALCGHELSSTVARGRLLHGPLLTGDLLEVEDPDRPLPGRALRVPDRVAGHLLGDDAPDTVVAPFLTEPPAIEWGDSAPLAEALGTGAVLAYLREPVTGSGRVLAASALRRAGLGVVMVDLERLSSEPDLSGLMRRVVREARLRGAGLVAAPIEAVTDRPGVLATLQADPLPVLLVGKSSWDPGWTSHPPLLVDVPPSTSAERALLWRAAIPHQSTSVDIDVATEQFLLRPEQVTRAASSALLQARLGGDGTVTEAHIRAGARAENGVTLDRLARRVEPAVDWNDLVLPPATLVALREVAIRARHRERVLGGWRMRPGAGRGFSVAALFAGDSGTGKTMSAEVVARDLGLDLYVVDLATVVDKYVGETEKNLERIFTAAAGVNGVLLFDEADAVFGRRSEVRDAHDRYANIESAYLLQRMETFDGLAILATNLRANIDEAFTRRLDVLVDFPLPDVVHRRALWERCLGEMLPRAGDLDLDFCAEAFELAGGDIRSAAVTAAYLAADDDRVVRMHHIVTAVQREYRKLGRMCVETEFGPYYALLS